MRLRKECAHKKYDAHWAGPTGNRVFCDGGEFLPEDAIAIEKVAGEWPPQLRRFAEWVIQYTAADQVGEPKG